MPRKSYTRRRFMATTAAASAAMVAAPFVRTAGAAGKLSIGFWDHWVPGANDATKSLVEAWAEKEKVDVQIDFITSQGNKLLLTIAAEAQAKSGHDIMAMPTWLPSEHAKLLEPVDDVMADLIKQNGDVNGTVEYLGKIDGKWVADARDRRQPDEGPVLAHRSDEAARRHRHPGHVSGRRRAARPTPGRSMRSSRRPRPATRPACRSASASARRRTRSIRPARSSTRSAPSWSTARRRSPSSPTRSARRSTTAPSWPSSIRRTRPPGTMPPTTSGWSPARAR